MPSGLPEPPEANRSIVIAMGDIKNSLTALLILVIIALTVGGNILVILAVSLERKLQIATNFFLRSLAVADMLVGILVMPVSLINILYDYEWPLPRPLCPIWIYLDVLFSTASIMHLCTISLDRYVAIRNPIEHSRFNSRTKAMMKIAAVWTISIGISMPIPVIGLYDEKKVFVCKEDTEHTNNNTNNTNHTNNTCVANMCVLNDKDFMLFGSFVAFFIPLVIMVVTYCLTIRVLQRQASVFLYEGNSTSQQPLQPAPPPAATSLLPQIVAPPPEREAPPPPSRKGSLSFLKGAEPGLLLSASPSDGVSVSEAPSALSSPAGRDPAGCHGRRGMMQAIKNERRASKVLGIVFFLFLIMWCPFFIANVTSVLCHGPKPPVCNNDLLEWLLKVFVWVGYISSGVNPLVYTLFNKTYRHAFSSYIRCRYRPDAASSALGKGPTLCPSHAVTPVMGSEAGGRGRKMLAVDRNSNCRNGGGGGEAGGNGSVLLGAVEPDEPTDDETEHGGGGGPEEEEAELVSATRAGVAFNGNSRASQEHTSSV